MKQSQILHFIFKSERQNSRINFPSDRKKRIFSFNSSLGLIILIFLFQYSKILAIPQLSYITPDIGAPGMSSYIEMIAPIGSTGTFGTDGFYLNNGTSTVRVECEIADDTNKIIIGPVIVSWNGRLISTQIFVNPNVQPTSWDWSLNTNDFRIPIRVYVDGQSYSASVYFYIVKLFHLGDISSSTERTLGAGSFGKRSLRGAMIIDSLILGAYDYQVSTDDPDGNLNNGDQGYLPFTLIAKWKISGLSSTNSILSVHGNEKYGGPGGGGGGGKYCDNTAAGDFGGWGFTGGGPGGRTGPSSRADAGIGSGSKPASGSQTGGNSINGTAGGNSTGAYESAGGGTGHPFGKSGDGCDNGSGCIPDGNYGGGSGWRDRANGGAGGYSTIGQSVSGSLNGGKVHGNTMLVPFAGGSGGASGNPNPTLLQFFGCSGNGGGGGGAIRICGLSVSSMVIDATGANGTEGDSNCGDGGAGSGGAINIGSKRYLNNVTANVTGGSMYMAAGAGRVRFDGFKNSLTITPDTSRKLLYRGLSVDSNTFVKRTTNISGSKDPYTPVRVYIKSKSMPWHEIGYVNSITESWSMPVTLAAPDTIFYVVAVHEHSSSTAGVYNYMPQYVTAQSATTMFLIVNLPQIEGDSLTEFHVKSCPGAIVKDTAVIWNSDRGMLQFNLNQAYFAKGTAGLSFTPSTQRSIAYNAKDTVFLQYTYQQGHKGIIIDTLIVPHNDNSGLRPNPWKIVCKIYIDSIKFDALSINLARSIDTIDLGKICARSSKDSAFAIKNIGNISINLNNLQLSNATNFQANIVGKRLLVQNDTSKCTVSFSSNIAGIFYSTVYISSSECATLKDSVILKAEALPGNLGITNRMIDFGNVCVGSSRDTMIKIPNKSGLDVVFNPTMTSNDPAHFTGVITGSTNVKNGDSLPCRITFSATTAGTFSAKLYFSLVTCPQHTDSLLLTGKGIVGDLRLATTTDFGLVRVNSKKTLTVKLYNAGSGQLKISSLPVLLAPFRIISYTPSPLPIVLNPPDTLFLNVEYSPTKKVASDTLVKVFSIAESYQKCIDTVPLALHGAGSFPELQITDETTIFDTIYYCESSVRTITIKNIGDAYFVFSNGFDIFGGDAQLFTIENKPALPDTLNPGESLVLNVRFTGRKDKIGFRSAILKFYSPDPEFAETNLVLKGYIRATGLVYPPIVDLGNIPLNEFSSKISQLGNTGHKVININSFHTDNSTITISPANLSLPIYSSSTDFTVTVKPTVAGNGLDSVYIYIDVPCLDTAKFYVKWFAKEGQIMTPTSLDFDTLFSCEEKSDSIMIYNAGAATFNVSNIEVLGVDKPLFKITDNFTYPITLKAKDTVFCHISFKPNGAKAGIKTAFVQISTNLTSEPIVKVDLLAYVDTLRIDYPKLIDFTTPPIGKDSVIKITLTNNNSQDIAIIGYSFADPIILVSPIGVTLPARGGTAVIEITARFSSTAQVSARLGLIFSPCKDTLFAQVIGSGEEGVFASMGELDFANIYYCMTDDSSITVYNKGRADYQITDLLIEGMDAGLFNFNPKPQLPLAVKESDSVVINLMFKPNGSSTAGGKIAYLHVKTSLLKVPDTLLPLKGTVTRFSVTANPPTINYGAAGVGKTKNIPVRLTNSGFFS